MKEWFTTTTSLDRLEDELNRLEALEHVIFTVIVLSGKVVVVSHTE
jgi:hypothetical protein